MKSRFHEHLTRIRKRNNFTQEQISQKLKVPAAVYAAYEAGTKEPDLEMLERISEVLNCSLDELFGRYSMPLWGSMIAEQPAYYVTDRTGSTDRTDSKYREAPGQKLAMGVQDFRRIREKNAYYVDKSGMIREFLDSEYEVTLLTRPRRFGKTLNMSMLAEFLDCTKKSARIFDGLEIAETEAMAELNTHPVIFLSFLHVKGDSACAMLYQLMYALKEEYYRYLPILKDESFREDKKEEFRKTYECLKTLQPSEPANICIMGALVTLCKTLKEYYGKGVYLLIDEYDTPFIAANAEGYYDEVRSVLSELFSSSLKGNPALEKAMLTGIQRVAKENIFSGLNNLIVCTVSDMEYSRYFGFTEDETRALLQYYGLKLSEEVESMYDGYLFGGRHVYNPWSVTHYAVRKVLAPYWVNTSENSIIRDAFAKSSSSFITDYRKLIEQGSAEVEAELTTSYYEQPDDASLWGLLVNAGMITIEENLGEDFFKVKIPNHEVQKAFRSLTAFYLQVQEGHISKMLRYLKTGEMEEFAEQYKRILLEVPSYHDLKCENSYHMMMLGMCAFLDLDYVVRSNLESGTGRADILLYAKRQNLPNYVLEFKYTKEEPQNLKKLAEQAILQIKEKNYDAGMTGRVGYIGLAHYGKEAEVVWE